MNIIWHHLCVKAKIMIQMNLFSKQKLSHRCKKQAYHHQSWWWWCLPFKAREGINWEIGTDMYTLLLLSHFSRVQLCATPEMAAHHAPPSLGFSRQEHWSGLAFPSPMHESEKWKVKVRSLSCVWPSATPWTAALQAPPSMGSSRQEYWSGLPLPCTHYCIKSR